MDLRHSLIPDELIEDLLHTLPKHNGPDMEADRGRPMYDYISFMEKMIGSENQDHAGGINGATKENPRSPRKPVNGMSNGRQ